MLKAKFSSGVALPGADCVQPNDSHIPDSISSSPHTDSRRPPTTPGHAIPQTKPLPSKGTEQTNLGSQGVVLEPPNRLPVLPGRVCQGRLPRENQTKSLLGSCVCLQTSPCHICCFELGPEYSSPKCIIYTYSRQFII